MKSFTAPLLLLLLLSWQISYAVASFKNTDDENGAEKLMKCAMDIITSASADVLLTRDCLDGIQYAMNDMSMSDKMRELASAIYQEINNGNKKIALNLFDEFMKYLCENSGGNLGPWVKPVCEIYDLYHTEIDSKARQFFILSIIGTASSTLAKPATEWALAMGRYAVPVGIMADVGEYGLTKLGYEQEGQTVGAVGNTVSGAMLGFSTLGPPGAAIGSILGYGTWMLKGYFK